MKIPVFRAKDIDSDKYYTGFYFEYPETNFCFSEDYANGKVKLKKCLSTYRTTDWGLPNVPCVVTIDTSTLEQIGEIDTEETSYIPDNYMKSNTSSDLMHFVNEDLQEDSDNIYKNKLDVIASYIESLENLHKEATDLFNKLNREI